MFSLPEKSCGVIPVIKEEDHFEYLIVKQVQGHWSFPKGHVEKGETELETAKRELGEEVGIYDAQIQEEPVFEVQYKHNYGWIPRKKVVKFFIGYMNHRFIDLQEEEILDYAWVTRDEGAELLHYESTQQVIRDVDSYLMEK